MPNTIIQSTTGPESSLATTRESWHESCRSCMSRAHDETVQAASKRPQALLSVLGSAIALDVPLPASGRLVIGRGEGTDVRVEHSSVSREHAAIEIDASGVFILDLGSKNGTKVRGARLQSGERARLEPGVTAEIGEIVVLLRPARVTPSVTPPRTDGKRAYFGESMRPVIALIDRIADDSIPVLLLGQTGVGKEVLAERLHEGSSRHRAPLLRVHCAAIAPNVFESELFGHEKGAFTGAHAAKPGLLESADGGTVFIDEVGEVPVEIQTKLLRVLENREVQRVGALTPRTIDVRFVAATNRDLGAEVAAGRFREDLYYRLSGVVVKIPSLAERKDEILPLARLFVERAAEERKKKVPELAAETERALVEHAWPGNVRELGHTMARAVLLSDDAIRPEHLALGESMIRSNVPDTTPLAVDDERGRILAALEACAGNQTEAAKQLGISRRTLLYKLDKLGIPRPRKR
jgi:transcriptional regulator of acetoin/glycerol metabolism